MRKILAFTVLFILTASFGAFAQFGGGQAPKFYGDFKPVVGAWSEYQMTMPEGGPMKMKVAIVGKEGPNYWYETVMKGGEGMNMVSKMLVGGNPNDQKNLKRLIVKSGSQPAMEMPIMGAGAKQGKGKAPAGKVVDKGMETVKVPAGTFKARHMQYQEGKDVVDAWVSEKVAPYGIVKTKGQGMEMVLLAQGMGAKTLITETPKKFQMPKMPNMPHGMPQGMGN